MTRVALITGAAGGIGAATARLFERHGWLVVGVDLRAPRGATGCARVVMGDVSDPGYAAALMQDVERQEGRLDALVNNAAVQVCKSLQDTSVSDWDTVMNVNARAPFLLTRAALPMLSVARGAVVNVSSVHAVATSTAIAAYAASKGALLALTRALALELGPVGVRVNALLPGAVDTAMLREGLQADGDGSQPSDARVQSLGAKHALGRVGQPAEIAEAILFLADAERSSFMTGQGLTVDGGALARLSTE
jgi:NAD(P)-dependent dehydrogenase (short-subunit alcohol dehydrogenase family)